MLADVKRQEGLPAYPSLDENAHKYHNAYCMHASPDPSPAAPDPAAAFRAFLIRWLETSGWSQYQLGLESGIGQGNISRWLNPDPRRRIQPTHDTLVKLAPIVGRSVMDLLQMAGRLPEQTPVEGDKPEDPPELASLIHDIRASFHETDAQVRPERLRVTRAVWHVQRRRPAHNYADNKGMYEGLDNSKSDYRMHTAHV